MESVNEELKFTISIQTKKISQKINDNNKIIKEMETLNNRNLTTNTINPNDDHADKYVESKSTSQNNKFEDDIHDEDNVTTALIEATTQDFVKGWICENEEKKTAENESEVEYQSSDDDDISNEALSK